MIPFEKNESTKFISPTKTPEYLAGGKPVISSSITDVVNPYGENRLVQIADTAEEFIACAEMELAKDKQAYNRWLKNVDAFLADLSWDVTANKMMNCINQSMIVLNDNTKQQVLRSVA